MGQVDSKPTSPSNNNANGNFNNNNSNNSSPLSQSNNISASHCELSNSTSSLSSSNGGSNISAQSLNNMMEFLNGPFVPFSSPEKKRELTSLSPQPIEVVRSLTNIPPPLELEEEILSKLPYFLPLISNSTRTELMLDRLISDEDNKPNNNSAASLNIDSIYRMLSTFKQYLEMSAVGISDKQDKLNQKIKEIDVLCTKAHQLMYKHVTITKQNLNNLPDVNKITSQLIETQQTVNQLLNSIDNITRILPDQHEEFMEFSESLKKSPINRNHLNNNIYSSDSDSNSILKGVSISNFISRVKDKKSVWITDILPKINTLVGTNKLRDLTRKGIDKEVRGLVWQSIIGNQLNITPEIYNKMVDKSTFKLNNYNSDNNHSNNNNNNNNSNNNSVYIKMDNENSKDSIVYSLSMIEMDLPRTFASFSLVNNASSQFRKQLQRILMSFVNYLPDIGYVQGMSYLGAMFLLHMDEYHSFVGLCNLIENAKFLQSLFKLNMKEVNKYMDCFQEMFSHSNSKLYNHFNDIGLEPHHYLIQWWLTVFCQSVPLSVAIRIWDCFISEGYLFLFVTSLGLLFHYRKILEENNLEYCKTFLSNLPSELDPDSLFKSIDHISVSYCSQLLYKLENKENVELELTSL